MGQIKAPIAGNSKAIDKIGNAELAHFDKQMLIHELIRDSLSNYPHDIRSGRERSDDWGTICEVNRRRRSRRGIRE